MPFQRNSQVKRRERSLKRAIRYRAARRELDNLLGKPPASHPETKRHDQLQPPSQQSDWSEGGDGDNGIPDLDANALPDFDTLIRMADELLKLGSPCPVSPPASKENPAVTEMEGFVLQIQIEDEDRVDPECNM